MSAGATFAGGARSPLPKSDVVIVGAGARTHTGSTALQVTMTARAGRCMPRESHMVDAAGEAIATCRLLSIGDDVWGLERLVAIAAPALAEAVEPWREAQRARTQTAPKLPAIVALASEKRPGFDARMARHFLRALEESSGVELDPPRSSLVTHDRGGGAEAFARAIDRLSRGEDDAIVVGGVDSWFDPDALEWLDRDRRLHGPTTENGFLPGEGAGFVVLTRRSRASSLPRLAQVLGAAVETEPRPWLRGGGPETTGEEPSHGLGMSLAIRNACRAIGDRSRRIGWALTDVVAERHRVEEWTYAATRAFRAFTEEPVHQQPLLVTGDLGAASAAVMAVIAATSFQAGCGHDDVALIATHSDGAERGVVVLAEEPS